MERFGFRPHLVFRTEVTSVLQLRGGRYLVTTKVAALALLLCGWPGWLLCGWPGWHCHST